MEPKRLKPLTFNWPLLSPQRPRSPSSFCSSSASSSRVPSFSSDITEFYDAAEDWSENMEQESIRDYRHPTLCAEGKIFESPNLKAFTFEELKRVTKGFHNDRVIGEGGFGVVYKGWIDERTFIPSMPRLGKAVAVKIWSPERHQGRKEWQAEVFYLGQLHHPNIVKLIGFCSEDDHLALVYEYLERGSLDKYLFGGRHTLSWALRIKVAIGIAKVLVFLHDSERPIILRDVKSSNVLLDKEFNVKLTDFGVVIAGPVEDETYISTEVMGTCGYAAPEYLATGNLYVKSDVYGFGVVLFELLSGLRPLEMTRHNATDSLLEWAKPYLGYERKLIKFMDPNLKGQYPKGGANEVAKLALKCIGNHPELRPHMSDVLTTLERLQHWNGPICSSDLARPPRSPQSLPSRLSFRSICRCHRHSFRWTLAMPHDESLQEVTPEQRDVNVSH